MPKVDVASIQGIVTHITGLRPIGLTVDNYNGNSVTRVGVGKRKLEETEDDSGPNPLRSYTDAICSVAYNLEIMLVHLRYKHTSANIIPEGFRHEYGKVLVESESLIADDRMQHPENKKPKMAEQIASVTAVKNLIWSLLWMVRKGEWEMSKHMDIVREASSMATALHQQVLNGPSRGVFDRMKDSRIYNTVLTVGSGVSEIAKYQKNIASVYGLVRTAMDVVGTPGVQTAAFIVGGGAVVVGGLVYARRQGTVDGTQPDPVTLM